MYLSTRSQYGLRAIFALARRAGEGPVALRTLARENNIPYKYLEQIFMSLRRAGIVAAAAGSKGGYRLATPAARLPLGHVIRTLDGTIAPIGCVSRIAYKQCTCPDEKACPLHAAMEEVRTAIISVIDRKTVADYLKDNIL
jgi:Rrf2 family protein